MNEKIYWAIFIGVVIVLAVISIMLAFMAVDGLNAEREITQQAKDECEYRGLEYITRTATYVECVNTETDQIDYIKIDWD